MNSIYLVMYPYIYPDRQIKAQVQREPETEKLLVGSRSGTDCLAAGSSRRHTSDVLASFARSLTWCNPGFLSRCPHSLLSARTAAEF